LRITGSPFALVQSDVGIAALVDVHSIFTRLSRDESHVWRIYLILAVGLPKPKRNRTGGQFELKPLTGVLQKADIGAAANPQKTTIAKLDFGSALFIRVKRIAGHHGQIDCGRRPLSLVIIASLVANLTLDQLDVGDLLRGLRRLLALRPQRCRKGTCDQGEHDPWLSWLHLLRPSFANPSVVNIAELSLATVQERTTSKNLTWRIQPILDFTINGSGTSLTLLGF
jgi:hypothetical protein